MILRNIFRICKVDIVSSRSLRRHQPYIDAEDSYCCDGRPADRGGLGGRSGRPRLRRNQ